MNVRLSALVIAASICGCQTQSPEPPVDTSPAAPPQQEPMAAEPALGLQAATNLDAFGLAMPEGAVLDTQSQGTLHFSVQTDFDALLAFFEQNLPDARLTRYERGAKFEVGDGTGRSVYLYRERGSSAWLVTVFDAGADPSVAAATQTGDGGSQPAGSGAAGGGGGVAPTAQTAGAANTGGTSDSARGQSGDGSNGQPEPTTTDENAGPVPLPVTPQQLDSRVGSPYTGDPNAYEPGENAGPVLPVVHPRVQQLIESGRVGGGRRPLNFSRGPREARRNPDAMF